jgi:crotonobetainyl-CoA:carnitine CoA-transferase CaiB-like acyl-CoA transferase
LFRTKSGYLALFVTRDESWRLLCAEIGHPDWVDDPRFATMHARFDNREELLGALTACLETASAVEWEERLRPLGITVGAVTDLGKALDGELVRSRGTVVSVDTGDGPLRLIGSPIRLDDAQPEYRAPPRLHEHTSELHSGSAERGL